MSVNIRAMKDTPPKNAPASRHDNFLADAIRPRSASRLSYMDGFRFGFGFFIAGLLVLIVLGGLTWAFVSALNLG